MLQVSSPAFDSPTILHRKWAGSGEAWFVEPWASLEPNWVNDFF
ncbi:hypothetical protein RBSWK_02986 [Rhodopirellula baltica SWK14]|uniref:Uncharacterized protein n=1 Tax=Rhodopirellula baltica SWK14 TaxID=993516 RepID=L7CH17_RHOBT|nr:hypothetical protein RBSWK_02986 [Rhodopirellula baltica SWK14]